jgi:type II secretory pathway component PulK
MRIGKPSVHSSFGVRHSRRTGSILIIVLWVAFGLVSLSLYFAHAMSLEMRAADNRAAALSAEQAIAGAARYVTNVLMRVEQPGMIPDLLTYKSEAVPIGDASVWFVGRNDRQTVADQPVFGFVDEASKLNLNTATLEMLEMLPRMTPELAAAIIDWRDSDDNATQGGAESETYARRTPPYRCKNANFESVDELRLVMGADLDILYGDDANLNGALDLNENDGEVSSPFDNRDGRLDPGILEYLTVYTRQPSAGTNVNNAEQMALLLQQKLNSGRANEILAQARTATSVLEFYIRSGMTREEFIQVEGDLIGTNRVGLVNVNTASEAVLACIPGIGIDNAPSLVAYRQSNNDKLNTVAWVPDVLERNNALRAAPYLTGRTYQFTADIAAVGHHGRGYSRVKFVFDTSEGSPRIRYRQDLTHLGWALGRQAREALILAKQTR